VISALFVVTACMEGSNAQGIVTTLRKRDLEKHLQALKDDDQVSLNLVQKRKASDDLPPKKVDQSPPTAPLTQPVSSNTHEHILKDPYKPKNSTSSESRSEVELTLPSEESEAEAVVEPEDSKEGSTSTSTEATKDVLKLATYSDTVRMSANTKVKQLSDSGPEYVLAYVVVILVIGILILVFLRIFGSLIFQCIRYSGAMTGYAGALVLAGFNTEAPTVDRMRKNIPALPAPEWAWLPLIAKRDGSTHSTGVKAGSSVPFSDENRSEVPSNPTIVTNAMLKAKQLKSKMASLQAALDSI